MSWRSATAWVIAIALVAAIATRDLDGQQPAGPSASASLEGRVVRVVDGDTISVRLAGDDQPTTVRYIGVDTPESVKPGTPVQCFAKVASHYNERLVEGRSVRLRVGREPRDRYGRLLAYVYVPAGMVNALLIGRGYARTLAIAPNTDFAARFDALERKARRSGLGLWRACPT